jgi:hypothetical protein
MTFVPALVLLAALDTKTLLDAPLLPEGAAWNAPGTAVLEGEDAALTVSLARPVALRALLLQADFDDTYWIEGSEDGTLYSVLWRVPALPAPPGLRSRFTRLDAPATVRFVRVRSTTGVGGRSVARLRLFEIVPADWPPALDHSLPGRDAPLFPALTPGRVVTLRLFAGGFGLAAALFYVLDRRSRRAARTLLAAAVVAALAWTNFLNFHFSAFTHGWELFHYYVGAKYAPELGYDGLYACTALADVEDGVDLGPGRPVRDLRSDRPGSQAEALASRPACRGRFDEAGWRSFRSDVAFFRGYLGDEWLQVLSDHGHNATPAWNLVGGAVARLVPASDGGMRLLASLDLALLGLLLVAAARVFGTPTACVIALFLGTNALSRFAWTGGALLRYDWLLLAFLGIAALRRGRPGWAGAALAASALLRVFPAVLLVGLGLQALFDAVFEGPATAWRRLRPVAAGALITVLAGFAASSAVAGASSWSAFTVNSRKYLQTEAENKLGLVTLLAFRPDSTVERLYDPLQDDPYAGWKEAQAAHSRRARIPRVVLVAVFFLLLAVASRGAEAWAAAALGAGLLPVLFQQGNYYYVLLSVFALFFASAPEIGLGLVALAWSSEIVAELFPAIDVRAAVLSLLACAFVYWAAWRLARRRFSP